MRRSRFGPAVLAALVGATGMAVTVAPSRASFPGTSGKIAYITLADLADRGHVHVTGSGQLTDGRNQDDSPAWSPDGRQLAFGRLEDTTLPDDPQRDFYIMLMNHDGTGLRKLVSSDLFDRGSSSPGFEQARVYDPTWSADGQRISFVVSGRRPASNGIWTIGVDGTGLTQTVGDPEAHPDRMLGPEWSPLGNELLYTCVRRAAAGRDFCVKDDNTGTERLVPIDWPGETSTGVAKWFPDGRKLAFSMGFTETSDGHTVIHNEVFTVNTDGTGLRRVTHSGDPCPGLQVTQADALYGGPAVPSPDGKEILVRAHRRTGTPTSNGCSITGSDFGLWAVDPSTGEGAVLIADAAAREPDWQPVLPKLTVRFDDGHGNVLKGLKVELRTEQGMVIDDDPATTGEGDYLFDALPPGDDYLVRAMLVDDSGEEGSVPSFDIRHAATQESGQDPVWVEFEGHIVSRSAAITEEFSIKDESPAVDSNVAPEFRHRLSAMANIYYQTRRFVDWVKENVTTDTGRTARYYTFATADPVGDKAVDANDAYYDPGNSLVVFGVGTSEYEERDGIADSAHDNGSPENGEWHEFTHHLWHEFVNQRDTCNPFGMVNHLGWNNPDTCDSMDEGFAMFLPTVAGQDLEGVPDASYGDMYNLEAQVKAWSYDGGRTSKGDLIGSLEDVAVAGLFWDLIDEQADTEDTDVINALGAHQPVTYTDSSGSVSIEALWGILTSNQPATVVDLRSALDDDDSSSITDDLDGDGVSDVSSLDHIFLMHGFFPVPPEDQLINATHRSYHYDVDTAYDEDPDALRNSAVGRTDHREVDKDGNLIEEFVPREQVPKAPKANVEVDLVDASGTPLAGGTIEIAVAYPGFQDAVTRRLGSGDGALVHLELPPYFDYDLPAGAALPPCDPAHDVGVEVALTATVNGYASTDQPSFDNCTYQRAAAEADGPAALSFAFEFPEDSLAPQTTVEKAFDETTGKWTVSLQCADPVDDGFASGCLRTEYRIDGGSVLSLEEPLEVPDRRTLRYRSVDAAGNEEAFRSVRLSAFDDEPPVISISSPADGATFLLNQSVNANYTCSDEGSGIATCAGPIENGAPLDTSTLGGHEFTVAAEDKAGNATSLTNTYRVVYDTEAFLPPIDSPPELNEPQVHAALAVKWRLRDALGIAQVDLTDDDVSFDWVAIDCESRDPAGGTTLAASISGLSYDTEAEHYVWVTKPPAPLARTCQRLEMTLNDGSVHAAYFRPR